MRVDSRYCPSCAVGFSPTTRKCPACGVALVDERIDRAHHSAIRAGMDEDSLPWTEDPTAPGGMRTPASVLEALLGDSITGQTRERPGVPGADAATVDVETEQTRSAARSSLLRTVLFIIVMMIFTVLRLVLGE